MVYNVVYISLGICIYLLTIIEYKFIINLSNIDYRIQQVNVPWSSVKIISCSERELLIIVTYNNYF